MSPKFTARSLLISRTRLVVYFSVEDVFTLDFSIGTDGIDDSGFFALFNRLSTFSGFNKVLSNAGLILLNFKLIFVFRQSTSSLSFSIVEFTLEDEISVVS